MKLKSLPSSLYKREEGNTVPFRGVYHGIVLVDDSYADKTSYQQCNTLQKLIKKNLTEIY